MSEAITMGPARPLLPTQFETKAQHNECNIIGMWLFIAQEIMFFGGLFTAYAIYRYKYPEVWAAGSAELNVWIGGGNTVVLLVSSLTMASTVYFTQKGRYWPMIWCFLATMALGTTFLVVKAFEWKAKWDHGLIPTVSWDPHFHDLKVHLSPEQQKDFLLFFVLYFAMTGMHALHMVIGVGIAAVILYFAAKRKFGPNRYMPMEIFGYYWHFVDIVWVFLFPMMYLVPHP